MSRDFRDPIRELDDQVRRLVAQAVRTGRTVHGELTHAGDRIVAIASMAPTSGDAIPEGAMYRVRWHGPWNRSGEAFFDNRMRRMGDPL